MAHDLIVDRSGLTEEMFHRGIKSSNIQLRPGTADLIAYCRDSNIPTVITSAGITNVIAAVLESHGVSSVHNENFHIGNNMYESLLQNHAVSYYVIDIIMRILRLLFLSIKDVCLLPS
jgi:phosphoserine phosphatase